MPATEVTELTGLESAIKITIVLLILSLITEKFNGFIKMYTPSLAKKALDECDERKREKIIQNLAIIVGVIISFVSNADFFQLVGGKDLVHWSDPNVHINIKSFFGCLLSGLFLSQGSKFFHDLLDTLLYAKNMKKGLIENQEIINKQIKNDNFSNANAVISYIMKPEDRSDDQEVNS